MMNVTFEFSELAQLRIDMDRDLVRIIDNTLDLGLLLAANDPDVDPAGVLHRRAAEIYADAVMLVEKVESVGERRRLEENLKGRARARDGGAKHTSVGKRSRYELNPYRNLAQRLLPHIVTNDVSLEAPLQRFSHDALATSDCLF